MTQWYMWQDSFIRMYPWASHTYAIYTYEWVLSHIYVHMQFIHMNESCHIYHWVIAYVWLAHPYVWHLTDRSWGAWIQLKRSSTNPLIRIYIYPVEEIINESVDSYIYISSWRDHQRIAQDWFIRVISPIHTCAMTHPKVCNDSSTNRSWLIYMCDMTLYVWYDPVIRVPWLIHMCAMTHPHVCHDSQVLGCINMCDMTHSPVCHDSSISVPWLFHKCAMTHPHVPLLSGSRLSESSWRNH